VRGGRWCGCGCRCCSPHARNASRRPGSNSMAIALQVTSYWMGLLRGYFGTSSWWVLGVMPGPGRCAIMTASPAGAVPFEAPPSQPPPSSPPPPNHRLPATAPCGLTGVTPNPNPYCAMRACRYYWVDNTGVVKNFNQASFPFTNWAASEPAGADVARAYRASANAPSPWAWAAEAANSPTYPYICVGACEQQQQPTVQLRVWRRPGPGPGAWGLSLAWQSLPATPATAPHCTC
jgi:hypothetical protein